MRRGVQRAALVVASILVVGVVLRLAAPSLVLRYVNQQLADMGEYAGSVADVQLSLIRGGYTLHDLVIDKRDSTSETPFVAMPQMDLALQWPAIFRGAVVGEAIMHEPVVNLVQSESEQESQLGGGVNWPQQVRDLFPFTLNLVRVENGLVTFRAPGIEAEESLTVRDFALELRNLTNVQDIEEPAFAEIDLRGGIMGNSPLVVTGRIDPNEQVPTFDINLSIENAQLVDVNPWLSEFLKVDAEAGAFSMFAELASAEGRFEGYVRPILENPEIFDADEETGGPFRKAWEALVGFATTVLENRVEDQVATQIPLRGEIEDPSAGVLAAVVNLVRNAFVAAFAHSLEGSISLRNVAEDVRCLEPNDPEQQGC